MSFSFAGQTPALMVRRPAGRTTRGKHMKMSTSLVIGAAVVALAGCHKNYGENNAASQVEANAENRAENITAASNNEAANIMNTAKNEAAAVKNEGENKAAAIKNAAEKKADAMKNASDNKTSNASEN